MSQQQTAVRGASAQSVTPAPVAPVPDERIPLRLIGAIVAVGSLAFIGILTETVMTVLFPELMVEFGVDTATVQWITTIYLQIC